ncbi:hypothetical protein MUK42_04745 [Musa troglodytarum]|uniref:Uncharacterized protein n=1 Tax=Musa troglodytarum TaxID=320322 RepID=A0A9E7ETC3_9LILI|nr:hypothetical protein MUK42_04745 [Musa troglodytarum]
MPDRRDSLQTVDLDQMLPHTGVGSSLVEFQDLDRGMCSVSSDKWDGMLSITTTVCFSTAEEDNIDDFIAWVFPFVQKIFLLKTPNLAVDLTVEHTENLGLRYNHLLQETDDIYLPLSLSNNERLLLSLKSYVLRHRNALDKECQLCFTSRSFKVWNWGCKQHPKCQRFWTDSGSGNSDNICAITVLSVEIELCYFTADRNLIKKAVKIALDDLKAKYAGTLLSCRSVKIRNHVPDLSRTIASLILSSNDPEFHGECASLLGLQSNDACTEETVDSCIREKIIRIIAMNDGKTKVERGSAPCLFECEGHLKEHCPEEKDDDSEEVNFDMELSQIQRLRSK